MKGQSNWKLPRFGWYRLLYGALGPLKPESPIPEHLTIERLEKPVDIDWNRHGVPSIKAKTLHDAVRVQGYLHGRFRAFQMDVLRRMPAGELAELVGPGGLPNDLFMRRLNLKHWAAQSLEETSARARAVLGAYTDGVNQALTHESIPSEYRFLRADFRPWAPEDSVILAYSLAWQLNNIWAYKWAMDRLGADPSVRPWLLDPVPGTPDITILPDTGKPRTLGSNGIGSNNWVVTGQRSESGQPLLANDPHLAPLLPSIWYQTAVQGGSLAVVGASLPGTPGVIIGQNQHIAWGVTNVNPDCQDLYRIRMNNENEYLVDGEPRTLDTRDETLRVRGAKDVRLTIETSHAGPVIHREKDGSRIALSWTGFSSVRMVDAILDVNLAGDWEQFDRALDNWTVPAQNFVYADDQGHIGYILAGLVPTHPSGPHFGCADGNTTSTLAMGTIPYEEMPRMRDPKDGWIVTANNAPTGDAHHPKVFSADSPGYRAERIRTLLLDTPRHSIATFQKIQLDDWSRPLAELSERLLMDDALPDDWRRELEPFDGHARVDSAAPTLLYLWAQEAVPEPVKAALARPLFFDTEPAAPGTHPFPENFWGLMGERLIPLVLAHFDSLERAQVYAKATERGRGAFGEGVASWTWGKAHQVVLFHPFIQSRAVRPLYGRRSMPTPGDYFTPRQAAFPVDPDLPWPRSVLFLPSYRQVLTPGHPEEGEFIHLTGQSGHPLSPHYDDMVECHWNGELLPMGPSVRTTHATNR